MENKHQIEHFFFRKLKELYPDLPDGKVCSPDPPDFIIDTDREIVAVEITQIHNEKDPNDKFPLAQKHATEDTILEKAKDLFSFRKGVPLHIRFHFENNIFLNKKQIGDLSDRICQVIELEMEDKVFDKPFSFYLEDNMPNELVYVKGQYFPNITDISWYSAKGRFLPKLGKSKILNIIRKKEEKINKYKVKVDKAMLVIVEGLIPNSWFDDVELFEQNELVSHFDKIFIIRNLSSKLIELK